jgi:hypothetical protein
MESLRSFDSFAIRISASRMVKQKCNVFFLLAVFSERLDCLLRNSAHARIALQRTRLPEGFAKSDWHQLTTEASAS